MMFVDKFAGTRPFLALSALCVVTLVAAIGAQRGAHSRRTRRGRFELLRDQHDRLELREERRALLDELERERRERLEAQESQTAHAGVPTPEA
jgi:hypothetical protein